MEQTFTPLFATKNVPGPLAKVGEIASILAEPGVPEETIASQVRRFAREGWIQAREERGSHRLYAPCDWAVAKVLSVAITNFGVEDRTLLSHLAAGLYNGVTRGGVSMHKMDAALLGTSRDELWTARLDVTRHVGSGERRFHVDVYNLAERATRPQAEGHAIAGSFMFILPVILPPILEAIVRPKAH